MNSVSVLAALDKIASTSGKKAKEEILDGVIDDPLVTRIFQMAYDPFITFGLTPPAPKSLGAPGTGIFDETSEGIWNLLQGLRFRKLTGNEAFQHVHDAMKELDESSRELLWRILSKDLRCGITGNTANRLRPGIVPGFTCMLAHKYEERKIQEWPVLVEPKYDGVRVICAVNGDAVKFFSRTGKEYTTVDHLAGPILDMVQSVVKFTPDMIESMRALYRSYFRNHTIVLDGEIISGSFRDTVSQVRRKSEDAQDAHFHIFDIVPYHLFMDQSKKIVKAPHHVRRSMLRFLTEYAKSTGNFPDGHFDKIHMTEERLAADHNEIMEIYQAHRAAGLEGVIVKPTTGLYHKARNHAWMKIKGQESEDLIVVGAFEGTGKYENNLGGLIVEREHNGEKVEVRVGGGFSDRQRSEIWAAHLHDQKMMQTVKHDELWVPELINRMIEVEFHEITPDGSLRHPRFIAFRDDKHDHEQEKAA